MMQLFICSKFQIKGTEIQVKNNLELVNQLRKVLRAKSGYKFFLQDENGEKRYNVELLSFIEDGFIGRILGEDKRGTQYSPVGMLISLPNKQEKLELIIQKLTEIGITHIFLWSSERSQLKKLNENKLIRINKIIKEAVEQSRGWIIPKLEIIEDIKQLHNAWNFVVFDLSKDGGLKWKMIGNLPPMGVVGPEGGLTENDYKKFPEKYIVKSLGNSVLRMETASIIGGWYLKNEYTN